MRMTPDDRRPSGPRGWAGPGSRSGRSPSTATAPGAPGPAARPGPWPHFAARSWVHESTAAASAQLSKRSTSRHRQPEAPLLAVVREPGAEQDRPGGQGAPLGHGQSGAVLAGQPEPFGEHRAVTAVLPRRRQRDRAPQVRHLAEQPASAGRDGLAVDDGDDTEGGPGGEVPDGLAELAGDL